MSSTECKYCPGTAASYYCEHCTIGFCLDCVPEDKRSIMPRCTLCRKDLISFNTKQVVSNFWTQWPFFLGIPFGPGIFITLVIYAFVGLLLPQEGFRAVVLGGVYWGLLLMMLFELSNLLAEGRTVKPSLQEIWNKGEPFLLMRLLVQVIFVSLLIYSLDQAFGLWLTVSLIILT